MSFAVVIVVLQGLRPEPAARGPPPILHLTYVMGNADPATRPGDVSTGPCREVPSPVTRG